MPSVKKNISDIFVMIVIYLLTPSVFFPYLKANCDYIGDVIKTHVRN
jgi:hypothetical protein